MAQTSALDKDLVNLVGRVLDKVPAGKTAAGKKLEDAAEVHVAEVVRHGDQLILPTGMDIPQAIKLLVRRFEYEHETTSIVATFDCFPWDGAKALYEMMKEKFGWVSMEMVRSFFGPNYPTLREIATDLGVVESIPWGRLTLFKEEGFIDTGIEEKDGRYIFKATATVQRKHETVVREIYDATRRYLKVNSIYRGKAIAARFLDEDGDPVAEVDVRFVDVRGAKKENLIFSKHVMDQIETNLYMPIERMKDIEACGMSAKFGVALVGTYGVGKTLAARVAAALAVENGITFIYCKRADELRQAYQLAMQYEPAAVFCEDIDRTLAGDRTKEMDDVLNLLDGIDSKKAKVVTIITSNDVKALNPAACRPGRIDVVVVVEPPDVQAAVELIHHYGGIDLDTTEDFTQVGEKLAGQIPAIIEEVVKRSKRAALRRTEPGSTDIKITASALLEAADTMKIQIGLLYPEETPKVRTIDDVLFERLEAGIEKALPKLVERGVELYAKHNQP